VFQLRNVDAGEAASINLTASSSTVMMKLPPYKTPARKRNNMRLLSVCLTGAFLLSTTLTAHASKIIFNSSEQQNALGSVYIMDEDGSNKVLVPGAVDSPSLSPDGTKVAYIAYFAQSNDVCVVNVDGSGFQRLTSTPDNDFHPSWSPDGKKILFSRGEAGENDIYVMNSNGSAPTKIADVADDSYPKWSPNGTKIAFTANTLDGSAIYTMKPDGSELTAITGLGVNWQPAWSHDSSKIAFAGLGTNVGDSTDIYIMDADGSDITQVTSGPASDLDPCFVTNNKLAYSSSRSGSIDIYSINTDGTNDQPLTTNPGHDYNPSTPIPNTAPVVSNDNYVLSTKGKKAPKFLTVAAPGVLANDVDVNGDTLTVQLVSAPAKGQLQVNSDGSFTFKPKGRARAIYTFTYRVSDGIHTSSVATVTISVNPKTSK
jgi:dipeptidyl aminopeptidase/acylaminoacyl peptidase